jgi:predicted ATP-binding protein involved in virulence
MKLSKIYLHNFRCYEEAWFQFHPNFTVLIGENGKGKTAVLDAIAIALGTYFQGSGIKAGQSGIRKTDARFVRREKGDESYREPLTEVYIKAYAEIVEPYSWLSALLLKKDPTLVAIEWTRELGDRGGKARKWIEVGQSYQQEIKIGRNPNLPLFLYYGSGRLWNTNRNQETTKPGSQFDAYHLCLDPKSDQKAFEKWYKKLTFSALQTGDQSSGLRLIDHAILTCIPGAEKIYHDVREDEIVLKLKNSREKLIPFDSLSDGYRNMVAMVADIAYRTARLNPHHGQDAAKETEGVVLIDEIDLHLHPKWQRQVVNDLQKAFPKLQFIATTHSPFIIQSLEPGEVIDLHPFSDFQMVETMPEGFAAPGAKNAYSDCSIEDIVETLMGIPLPQRSQRYQDMYNAAQDYYQILQDAHHVSEEQKDALKQRLDELSAPFSDNIAYHAFLEMERLAAGLGSSHQRSAEL